MRRLTITVSELLYENFRRASKHLDRPMSELIHESMEQYRRERLRPAGDLQGFRPRSLGRVLWPLERQDDLLEEMLNSGS